MRFTSQTLDHLAQYLKLYGTQEACQAFQQLINEIAKSDPWTMNMTNGQYKLFTDCKLIIGVKDGDTV